MKHLLLVLALATPVLAQVQPGGSGVSALNGKKGSVTLAAGTNVTITPSGNTLTIAASGGAGDVTDVNITTTAPITGGANCATAACSFTLGISSATFAIMAAQTSADLAAVISDETGTGKLVFDTSPVFTTPNIGSATGSISGNAGTATALAANPADCSANQFSNAIAANGDLTCAQPSVSNLSDGSTGSGAIVLATSPTITTPTISARASAAGTTLSSTATAPAQITTAQAGSAVTVNASNAVAGSSVAGAAAGGSITLTAGDAARLSSGNANGGDVAFVAGAGIGSGKAGLITFTAGAQGPWRLGLGASSAVAFTSATAISSGTGNFMFGVSSSSASGANNTSFGNTALNANTSGADNSGFGYGAGSNTTAETNGLTPVANTTGGDNTYIGFYSGGTANNLSRTIQIGAYARANASDMATIGGKTVATFQLGSDSSDTQSARVLRAAGARASTDTDTAASPLTLAGGIATGTGKGGDVRIQTSPAITTGSTAQTLSDRAVFAAKQVTLTESSATLVLNVGVASNTVAGGTLKYTIRANDATDYQAIRGTVEWSAVNKGGTVTVTLGTPTEVTTTSTGTLTNTTTAVANGNSVDFKLNAVSSLTQTTLYAYVSGQLDGTGAFTTQ